MSFYEGLKSFIKNHSIKSDQLISSKSLKEQKHKSPLTIKHKLQLAASDISRNQQTIDAIVKKIIKKDYSKRSYGGKTEKELSTYNKKIYQYESYRTNNVKLVPSQDTNLELFVEDIYLGELPDEDTPAALHYLQSTICMSFAYVTGGPYHQFDPSSGQIMHESDPYDLTIFIQFS